MGYICRKHSKNKNTFIFGGETARMAPPSTTRRI